MAMTRSFIFCMLNVTYFVNAYKILVVFPIPGTSMNSLGHGIVRHLLSAEHDVTYVTVFPMSNAPTKKLRQIDISKNIDFFKEQDIMSIGYYMNNKQYFFSTERYMFTQEMGIGIAEKTFTDVNLQRLLSNTQEKFDVVIADLFETEIYSALSALYDCPIIWSYSMGPHWFALRLIDEPSNPAFSIDYFSYKIPPLNFLHRFHVLISRALWSFIKWFYVMPREKKIYENIFRPLLRARGKSLPHYDDLIYNASLIFSNDYFNPTITKLPQNLKLVGGYHIQDPLDPLPTEFENLFRSSDHGILYFSMGSMWRSKDFPFENTLRLLKMFGELKQTVVWKYEEDIQNVPKNVHIVKWVPQQSILANLNCTIFITHGGQLSITEAVNFGVPIIGIPINYDQFTNVENAVQLGYALKVDLNGNLHNHLKIAIDEILQDEKYRRRAKEVSAIFHDRPVPPGKELVHWVEHVVRTHGAPHLRSPAILVPWYQKMYLDLLTVIVVSSILFCFVINKLHKSLRRKYFQKKINKKQL